MSPVPPQGPGAYTYLTWPPSAAPVSPQYAPGPGPGPGQPGAGYQAPPVPVSGQPHGYAPAPAVSSGQPVSHTNGYGPPVPPQSVAVTNTQHFAPNVASSENPNAWQQPQGSPVQQYPGQPRYGEQRQFEQQHTYYTQQPPQAQQPHRHYQPYQSLPPPPPYPPPNHSTSPNPAFSPPPGTTFGSPPAVPYRTYPSQQLGGQVPAAANPHLQSPGITQIGLDGNVATYQTQLSPAYSYSCSPLQPPTTQQPGSYFPPPPQTPYLNNGLSTPTYQPHAGQQNSSQRAYAPSHLPPTPPDQSHSAANKQHPTLESSMQNMNITTPSELPTPGPIEAPAPEPTEPPAPRRSAPYSMSGSSIAADQPLPRGPASSSAPDSAAEGLQPETTRRSAPYTLSGSSIADNSTLSPDSASGINAPPRRSSPYSLSGSSIATNAPPAPEPASHVPPLPQRSSPYSFSGPSMKTSQSVPPNPAPSIKTNQSVPPDPVPSIKTNGFVPQSPPPPATTTCIDIPMAFAATWYWHPRASDYMICSRCYVDHIHSTVFAGTLKSQRFNDGKARQCFFSMPRMKDHVFPAAVASRSIESALDFMRLRSSIPTCRGAEAVPGGAGYTWYGPKTQDQLPGFIACRACFEDFIAAESLAGYFEEMSQGPSGSQDPWTCDMALMYVRKQFGFMAKTRNWSGFVQAARARLEYPPCPGLSPTPTVGKTWFVPKGSSNGLMLCVACYSDFVGWTNDASQWCQPDFKLRMLFTQGICCGARMNMKICGGRGIELEDATLFRQCLNQLGKTQACSNDGIKNGEWYTLRSNPHSSFKVCGECYITVINPLNIGHFFVRKSGIARNETHVCFLNQAHPRLGQFLPAVIETYSTLNASSLESCARAWSDIKRCALEKERCNLPWYGWADCTICPECYHEFAANFPSMVSQMELHGQKISGDTLCALYSPRMRKLFRKCAQSSPPDIQTFVSEAAERRLIHTLTMRRCRDLIMRAKIGLAEQNIMRAQATQYRASDIGTYSDVYRYSGGSIGSGYGTLGQIRAAECEEKVRGMMAQTSNLSEQVGILEQQWLAVE